MANVMKGNVVVLLELLQNLKDVIIKTQKS